ncbi:MAG: hypothetical protein ABSH20_08160 [Tepidisphaeraceae bacterium]|jgi:hypothetical protein
MLSRDQEQAKILMAHRVPGPAERKLMLLEATDHGLIVSIERALNTQGVAAEIAVAAGDVTARKTWRIMVWSDDLDRSRIVATEVVKRRKRLKEAPRQDPDKPDIRTDDVGGSLPGW